MRVLLVEPWLAGSHGRWAEGFARSSSHEVEVLGLSGELWRWRLQGGAAPLADKIRGRLAGVDLLLVSGLVDVAHLVGLCHRSLDKNTAVVVYQHESQLVYPAPEVDRSAVLANWASWLVADAVAFNSDYHRQAVLGALPGFLENLPDDSHVPMWPMVAERFDVLPLGLDLGWVDELGLVDAEASGQDTSPPAGGSAPIILWPHRWEADKDPAAFSRALDRLDRAGLDYRLVLAGEATAADGQREVVANSRPDKIDAIGPFETDAYRAHVRAADIVVSCARHEFFGAAMAEAVAAGARPVAPHGLAYPEVLGPDFVGYQPGSFGSALEAAVVDSGSLTTGSLTTGSLTSGTCSPRSRSPQSWARRYDWNTMAAMYDEYLGQVAARVRSRS